MSIPLINEVNKNDINTSIIAIKKDIERINTLLGLNNTEEIDTSIFATKEELEQAETDLAPVDEVTSGNMHAATSNIVAKILSYSTTEHKTGKKWIDGKDIYSKTIDCGALPNATTKTIAHNISNLRRFTKVEAISITANNNSLMLPYVSPASLSAQVGFTVDATNIEIRSASNYSTYEFTDVTLEYTKTTD